MVLCFYWWSYFLRRQRFGHCGTNVCCPGRGYYAVNTQEGAPLFRTTYCRSGSWSFENSTFLLRKYLSMSERDHIKDILTNSVEDSVGSFPVRNHCDVVVLLDISQNPDDYFIHEFHHQSKKNAQPGLLKNLIAAQTGHSSMGSRSWR